MIDDNSEHVNRTRPFFTAIPDDIAKREDIPPTAKLVAGSIFTRTFQRRITRFINLRAAWIAEDWGISADSVTRALKLLVELEVIEVKRTASGLEMRFVSLPQDADSDSAKSGEPFRKKRTETPQKADSDSAKSGMLPYTVTQTVSQTEQQQEELSLLRNRLPDPTTYKPENLTPRKGAVLTEAQRNLATQLLGATGQDRQFAASVSQEMANKTGFLEFYLKATIKASKERKIKGTTIAYLIGSINNSWANGDWVDPDQAAKEQRDKEIAARRARLDRLT